MKARYCYTDQIIRTIPLARLYEEIDLAGEAIADEKKEAWRIAFFIRTGEVEEFGTKKAKPISLDEVREMKKKAFEEGNRILKRFTGRPSPNGTV